MDLTNYIIKELELRNVKSIKQVKQTLELIENNIMSNIISSTLENIQNYIENTENITILQIYLYINQILKDLNAKDEKEQK